MKSSNKQRTRHNSLISLLLGSVFILNALIFLFQALTKNLFPPLLLPLREAFMINNAQAGLLVTLVFIGYALARFPSGVMADHIGCTKTVILGSGAMTLFFFGIAVSPSYPIMAFMTFVLGVSSGIYVTAGYTLAIIIGSRERAATATAAFESFGIVAAILSPVLVTVFVIFLSWQLLFVISGLLLAIVTVVFYRFRKHSDEFEKAYALHNNNGTKGLDYLPGQRNSTGKLKRLLGDVLDSSVIFRDPLIRRFIVWSTLVGGLGALSWTGINAFIPTFLVEERGYSYEVANRMFIVVAAAGLAAKIGTGWLADRFGNNPVLFFNLVFSVGLFIAMTMISNHWLVMLTLALLGAACLNTNTLINAYVIRNMPPKYQGAGFGLFSTAYTVIYSFGPYLTGILSELFTLSRAIQFSAIGAVIAAGLILAANYFVPKHLLATMASN